ncbi:DUF1700 domain-containing protein [Paenibacillus lautus]|uniref:DUF1700 domain-containing protein n=1 Tax=Paenibacillus lautus TaxID=1401 RepID=UPI002DB8E0EE|nr:DUF1700 domain-containing protein [Paenibacillus lautus]MEC0256066.1 DUF1700 domain-containing protein [Paenibacillus lautus]
MTKKQFISILESRLAALPPDERQEFIQDVESHFIIGMQNGRTEEEIARELGDPFEMAKEALGDRYVDMDMPAPAAIRRPSSFGKYAAGVGLFFCALVAVPFLAALWSGGVAIALGALATLLSPVLVLLDYIVNGTFYPAKLFLSISLLGIGIFLGYATRSAMVGLLSLTLRYSRWNTRLLKGRDAQ